MKKLIAIITLLFTLLLADAADHRLYFWIKSPRFGSNHGLELSVNGKHYGSLVMSDLNLLHLAGDKKYTVELFDKGHVVATLEIADLKDSFSYYHLDMSSGKTPATFERVEALTGAVYVMQSDHFRFKRELYEEGMEEIVRVDEIKDQSIAYGSGFLISEDGYIVTNYHVVDGYKKFTVKGIEGDFTTEYEADVVAKDVNNDLVLLQLKNKAVKFSTPPYALRNTGASTGEDIFVLGYPLGPALGDEIKLTTGVISAKSGVGGNVSSYQVSAAAQPGNSGGPLFDNDGNVLGVVNSKIMKAENITYAVKAVYLQALIGMLPAAPKQPESSSLKGLKLTEKVSAISRFVYIIRCQ